MRHILLKLEESLSDYKVFSTKLLNLLFSLCDQIIIADLSHSLVSEVRARGVLSESTDHIVKVQL
jgi:hypothetical protein